MELKRVLYRTIHKAGLSVEELADRLGISSSMLYRAGNPNDDGARFPLEKVIGLMRATKDYSILHHIASRTDHVVFKLPRAAAKTAEDMHEFQLVFTVCFSSMLAFYRGEATKEDTVRKIDDLISAAAGHRKAVDRHEQPEFPL